MTMDNRPLTCKQRSGADLVASVNVRAVTGALRVSAPYMRPTPVVRLRALEGCVDPPPCQLLLPCQALGIAQPLTRILRLTIDDVLHQDNEVSIRLGDPPSPVPEPFAGLLLRHIDQRLNLTTATNPDARWLFPGRRGGQPMTPEALESRLRQHRIPGLRGRTAAIRRLIL